MINLLETLTIKNAILKSQKKADKLMDSFPSPNNDWEKEQFAFFKLQLVLEDLRYRKIILPKIEKEIRRAFAPRLYRHILDDPQLDNERIKKMVEESLLNDWLRMRYGKGISITYGEETA